MDTKTTTPFRYMYLYWSCYLQLKAIKRLYIIGVYKGAEKRIHESRSSRGWRVERAAGWQTAVTDLEILRSIKCGSRIQNFGHHYNTAKCVEKKNKEAYYQEEKNVFAKKKKKG